MNSVFIISVSICLLQCVHHTVAMECYSCTNHDKDCKTDPKRLQSCDLNTTECYIYKKDEVYFERGCGNKGVAQYEKCKKLHSLAHNCFICMGHRCNPMAIASAPSQQYCLFCNNQDECEKSYQGKLCKVDSLFGPQKCFMLFNQDGTKIVSKGCANEAAPVTRQIFRGQFVFCVGIMCNFANPSMFQRCIYFQGLPKEFDKKTRKVVDCFVPGQHKSDLPGCYIGRGKTYLKKQVHFGCSSQLTLQEYKYCRDPHTLCNTCEGDMCNDIKVPSYLNRCFTGNTDEQPEYCESFETRCFRHDDGQKITSGCMTESTPGIYTPNTILCSNLEDRPDSPCRPQKHATPYIGCYDCFGHTCDDVLITEAYLAKITCPVGTKECYSTRRTDGTTFRGCLTGTSEGVRVCRNALGNCKRCSSNYCNYEKVVPLYGMCYKTNWDVIDNHEATMRLADCTGVTFRGQVDHCYIASSARLFMRMGCITEMSGIDDTWQITQGDTSVVWLYRNWCYKCVSNYEGFCFDTTYLKPVICIGLNKYPARGCYVMKDKRANRLERGCITELNEYMLRLCDIPFFYYLCNVCTGDGCNDERFEGFD